MYLEKLMQCVICMQIVSFRIQIVKYWYQIFTDNFNTKLKFLPVIQSFIYINIHIYM